MTPTARSLQHLRQQGALAAVVERYNSYAKRTFDLFGFIDVVALDGQPGVLGVQATSADHVSHRVAKLAEVAPAIQRWLEAGNRLVIWGWAKRGARGKRKVWTLNERVVLHADVKELAPTPRDAGGPG